VIKRIGLLMVAALVAAMMLVATSAPAFADPNCNKVGGNNKNCVTDLPGKAEDSGGQAINKNPNKTTTFKGRPQ
jgi:hypothetical protein